MADVAVGSEILTVLHRVFSYFSITVTTTGKLRSEACILRSCQLGSTEPSVAEIFQFAHLILQVGHLERVVFLIRCHFATS